LDNFDTTEIEGPVRDYIGYGRNIPKVHWPNDARIAINIVVNYEEGSERMKSMGDTVNEGLADNPYPVEDKYRDLATESLYEYGSRAAIWRLQRLFEKLDIPITIFGCAVALERNLAVAEWIREKGYDVCCHGWRWEEVFRLSREEEREHMKWAIESIEKTCGARPLGWYCRYGPSIHTRELVVEDGGFLYDSDSYNDDIPYFTEISNRNHLVIPYSMTLNDQWFVSPQGYGSPSDYFDALKRAFDYLWEEGSTHPRMMNIGLHPRLVGQPSRISALRDFIQYAQQKREVWFAKRADIAQHWLNNYKSFKR